MDLEIYHIKWSKPDRERQVSYDVTYKWNLKEKWYKWTYLWKRNRLSDFKNKLTFTEGETLGEGQIKSLGLTYTHYYKKNT